MFCERCKFQHCLARLPEVPVAATRWLGAAWRTHFVPAMFHAAGLRFRGAAGRIDGGGNGEHSIRARKPIWRMKSWCPRRRRSGSKFTRLRCRSRGAGTTPRRLGAAAGGHGAGVGFLCRRVQLCLVAQRHREVDFLSVTEHRRFHRGVDGCARSAVDRWAVVSAGCFALVAFMIGYVRVELWGRVHGRYHREHGVQQRQSRRLARHRLARAIGRVGASGAYWRWSIVPAAAIASILSVTPLGVGSST